ncbi:MAG: ChaN family lipoprotein, partial [Planctomycetes bacterium]|nr:ChaN family lipoprotein [Planctomycetota bacterium]
MESRPNIMPWLLLAASCSPAEFVWQQPVPEHLARYRRAFDDAVGDTVEATCSPKELLAAVDDARVLWLGDHHRSTRLHALHGNLLEQLARSPRRVVLVLEALGVQDQRDVDAFLDDRLTLQELTDRCLQRWAGSWLDDRDLDPWYYRSLCTTARRHGWRLVGLEPTPRPPLARRDAAMASRLAALAASDPQALVVVVVGQAHLLGEGDLVRRTGLPAVALGGEP